MPFRPDATLAVMAKPTGLTPILKDIDAAFSKEQRKPTNEALLKFYGKREPISVLLTRSCPSSATRVCRTRRWT